MGFGMRDTLRVIKRTGSAASSEAVVIATKTIDKPRKERLPSFSTLGRKRRIRYPQQGKAVKSSIQGWSVLLSAVLSMALLIITPAFADVGIDNGDQQGAQPQPTHLAPRIIIKFRGVDAHDSQSSRRQRTRRPRRRRAARR